MRTGLFLIATILSWPAASQSSLTSEQRTLITGAAGMALIHVHCEATLRVDTKLMAASLMLGGVDLNRTADSKFYDAEVTRFARQITANNRAAFCAIADSRFAGNGIVFRR